MAGAVTSRYSVSVVKLTIGDPDAVWFQVKSIKEAEDLVLARCESMSVDYQYDDKDTYDTKINFVINQSNQVANNGQRGIANVAITSQDMIDKVFTAHPGFYSSPRKTQNRYELVGSFSGNICTYVFPDVTPETIHIFYKSHLENNAIAYLTTDMLAQKWLCFPTRIGISGLPTWQEYFKTIRFIEKLPTPDYLGAIRSIIGG